MLLLPNYWAHYQERIKILDEIGKFERNTGTISDSKAQSDVSGQRSNILAGQKTSNIFKSERFA